MKNPVLAAIFLAVALIGVVGLIWSQLNKRGYRLRGNSSSPSIRRFRLSDNKLNRYERKTKRQAESLIKNGKVIQGAQLMDSIGLSREAIQLLEENGKITEACKILLRMNRPNRAGILYARNNMWERAIDCFKIAGMNLEVAKCYKEIKKYAEAASYFNQVNRKSEAAYCYKKAGKIERAAKLYIEIDEFDKAKRCLEAVIASKKGHLKLRLEEKDYVKLINFFSNSKISAPFVNLFVANQKFSSLVYKYIMKKNYKLAKIALSNSETIGFNQIIGDIKFDNKEVGNVLANLFQELDFSEQAGIIFERIGSYQKAGENFEAAGNTDRAIHCYQRCGNNTKINELKGSAQHLERTANNHPPISGLENFKQINPEQENENKVIINIVSNEEKSRSSKPEAGYEYEPQSSADEDYIPVEQTYQGDIKEDEYTLNSTPKNFHIFSQSAFLDNITGEQKRTIYDNGGEYEYQKDQIVLDYGEKPTGIYCIITGNIKCYKVKDGEDTLVSFLEPTDTFGEVYILSGYQSNMKYVANDDLKLFFIAKPQLDVIFSNQGTLATNLYKCFCSRLIVQFVGAQEATLITRLDDVS